MQVVLKKRVTKLGKEYDVINVKPGFARNYLFPQQLAIPATKQALRQAEAMKSKVTEKIEAAVENAREVAEKLKDVTLSFKKKARGEKLYGSIKETDLVSAIEEQAKVTVGKEMIILDEPLKDLGEHTIKLQISEEVAATIKVKIEAE